MTVRSALPISTLPLTIRSHAPARLLIALASGAAGVAHLAAIPEHRLEDPMLAVAFVVVAIFQVTWAVLFLISDSPRLLLGLPLAGVVFSAVFISAWSVSRTIGLPMGAHVGGPEVVGSLDLAATLLEAVTLVGSLTFLAHKARRRVVLFVTGLAFAVTGGILTVGITPATPHPHRESAPHGHSLTSQG
ncbi:MAG: hypothetical protein ABIS18_06235 [Actinomycetota bacterium]